MCHLRLHLLLRTWRTWEPGWRHRSRSDSSLSHRRRSKKVSRPCHAHRRETSISLAHARHTRMHHARMHSRMHSRMRSRMHSRMRCQSRRHMTHRTHVYAHSRHSLSHRQSTFSTHPHRIRHARDVSEQLRRQRRARWQALHRARPLLTKTVHVPYAASARASPNRPHYSFLNPSTPCAHQNARTSSGSSPMATALCSLVLLRPLLKYAHSNFGLAVHGLLQLLELTTPERASSARSPPPRFPRLSPTPRPAAAVKTQYRRFCRRPRARRQERAKTSSASQGALEQNWAAAPEQRLRKRKNSTRRKKTTKTTT